MSMRHYFLATTALASFGTVWLVVPGVAADMSARAPVPISNPAVSGVNFKIDGFGGWGDATGGVPDRSRSGGLGGSNAALTIPFGERFGVQVDGLGGSWGGNAFWGVGGHGFWRDPSVGLLGVIGSWTRLDRGPWPFIGRGSGIEVDTVGGEGEYYWNSVTLRGVMGQEGGDVPSRFFTTADARWYVQKDLMLSIGYRHTGGLNALALGGEWLTTTAVFGGRVSLFAEGRVGESDFRAVWGGLRVYFGKSPTLIDKHRRDDPPTPDNLFAAQKFSTDLDKKNKNAQSTLGTTTSGTSFAASDVRLKRDIVLLARLDNGIGVYRYRYIWDDTLYVGVMAQEVLAIVPQAVQLGNDGYLRVDYGCLGLRLATWDEWQSVSDTPAFQSAA
jgi:hypothetical protein